MSHRRLVFVSGLTLGDYLLWNWSLNHNHEAIALIAGLTLPPLAVWAVWMLVVSLTRLAAQTARGSARSRETRRAVAHDQRPVPAVKTVASDDQPGGHAGAADRPPRKIAA